MSLDPIALQVVTGALRAACEEMGATLVRSAHSANIKERRDCSTALFDPAGEMVMQAEHIPVHLGAMPAAVEAVLRNEHAPGRSWLLNDPFAGGTHLPDITVVTPVFEQEHSGVLLGFAASRAHHADVGGRVPGSMPADSTTLEEEGVVIPPTAMTEEVVRGAGRAHAPAGPAPGRPARPDRRQHHRRAAPGRAGAAHRRRPPARGHRRGARLRRAAHPRVPGRAGRPAA